MDYYRFTTAAGDLVTWSNGVREDGTVHVGVRTENAHGRYPHNGPVNGGWDGVASSCTFSRVPYRVFAHYAFTAPDTLEDIHNTVRNWMNPLTRADGMADGTPAAVRAYRATVEPALRKFLAGDVGRRMLADGVARQTAERIAKLESRETELATELAAVRRELRTIRRVTA